jgi:hypothetical protein
VLYPGKFAWSLEGEGSVMACSQEGLMNFDRRSPSQVSNSDGGLVHMAH